MLSERRDLDRIARTEGILWVVVSVAPGDVSMSLQSSMVVGPDEAIVAVFSEMCRFGTTLVTESWLLGTESPASLVRLWLAMGCSAAFQSISCVAGPGFSVERVRARADRENESHKT